ncbi:alpha/beta hydrolase [uncultured Pseudokineococcus sp.]|uniref:alpha/beta hydrolase n=1 Tax=uncultured Pseudokineococcus sp. TaxID=1642928 RepID=UPI002607991D|nr:alpha/beta hydrolase [uncultured Pseudokineococcus sp.]
MDSTTAGGPVLARYGTDDTAAPLVVLLHGRGSDEQDIIGLAPHLPAGPAYVAVRAPIAEGHGWAWFANQGIGRPVASSLAATTSWFGRWLDQEAPPGRPVLLVGYSGGATFAGGLVLDQPARYAGLATVCATLPVDAGLPLTPGRLQGLPVLVVQGQDDVVIPPELQQQTWEYLHQHSGAALTAHRRPGGHGLTATDVALVAGWITTVLTAAPYVDRPVHDPATTPAEPAGTPGDQR